MELGLRRICENLGERSRWVCLLKEGENDLEEERKPWPFTYLWRVTSILKVLLIAVLSFGVIALYRIVVVPIIGMIRLCQIADDNRTGALLSIKSLRAEDNVTQQ